jgi:hypothetical protein
VNWLQFSCGIGVHLQTSNGDICDQVGAIAPNQLNYPSIAFGALPGKASVTRTVTNVTKQWDVYFGNVQAPAGYAVSVSPRVLLVAPGGTATFTVTVTRTTAALNTYGFGSLTWVDLFGNHRVTSPIAVQASALSAPPEVTGTGTQGSMPIALKSGYTGTLTASGAGLAASEVHDNSLVQDPAHFDVNAPATGPGTGLVEVNVPAGTTLARFATFAGDYAPGTDVDIYAYSEDTGQLVGVSAGGTATETITLTDPGTYAIFVDLFANPAGTSIDVKLDTWALGSSTAGNFAVSPATQSVTLGGSATVTASWQNLTAGGHYLGLVQYTEGTSPVGATIVSVNP